jgi:hypothetical protein
MYNMHLYSMHLYRQADRTLLDPQTRLSSSLSPVHLDEVSAQQSQALLPQLPNIHHVVIHLRHAAGTADGPARCGQRALRLERGQLGGCGGRQCTCCLPCCCWHCCCCLGLGLAHCAAADAQGHVHHSAHGLQPAVLAAQLQATCRAKQCALCSMDPVYHAWCALLACTVHQAHVVMHVIAPSS